MAEALESFPPYLVALGESFEDMYRREYPNFVAVAHALTGASSVSEDLVQDTMVKAFIHWDRVSRLNRPGGWCLRVLTNCCRSWWRRGRTADRYLTRFRREDFESTGPSVEFVAFWQAVRRLPSRPRLAVVLFYAGDRSVAEVASVLGVPEGTVKSDLARSRVVLRAELER